MRLRLLKKESAFTLAELLVAIALGALVLVGTMTIARYLVLGSAQSAERTIARLEAQYVNLWLSEDVVRAQSIYFGNTTGTGFPLEVSWTDSAGVTNNVTYSFVDIDEVTGLGQLTRTLETIPGEGNSTSLVAENLDTAATMCYRKTKTVGEEQEPVNVLVVDVTASVGLSEASSRYEIHPRRTVVSWLP